MQRSGLGASKIVFLSGVMAFFAACSGPRPDIIQVGPWFESKSADEVAVFSSRNETSKPWGGIAIIHSAKFPPGNKKAIEKTKKQARIMAAKIGADGLILNMETVMDGSEIGIYHEAEVYISALAFKYVAELSTAPQK